MQLRSVLKKSFIYGMSMVLLAPSFSHAADSVAGTEQAIQLSRYLYNPEFDTARAPIKPSWGNFQIVPEHLRPLYMKVQYQPFWVTSDGRPNELAASLRTLLLGAARHGLNPAMYWDATMENGYTSNNRASWVTFEMLATEALIRYATHLSTGRFDPNLIDDDIMFKRKKLNLDRLLSAIQSGAGNFINSIEQMAPTHPRYRDLMYMTAQLYDQKAAGGWEQITSPGVQLKLGVKNPVIIKLRKRLTQMGYYVSDYGGQLFDQEFDTALRQFQAMNGLTADGVIGVKSEVLRALNVSIDQRIQDVALNMEKLRWLPENFNFNRNIFVNLATSEFRMTDQGQLKFYFKTINGQSFRRTPTMKDSLSSIVINPNWTVPESIAYKDKLPKLRQDSRYLDKHNMVLMNKSLSQTIDASSINWRSVDESEMNRYWIVQKPGYDNALGVVKFQLSNGDAIYMHDTNERNLFTESERHLSSGCVRLERPLEVASYILQDIGMSYDDLVSMVPSRVDGIDRTKEVKRGFTPWDVYFMYLTAERGDNGQMRFINDVYGQDSRIARTLQNTVEEQGLTPKANERMGVIQVLGKAGEYQVFKKVKAVRCDTTTRGACDVAVSFDLNVQTNLPEGNYLLSFENSMYPGFVQVRANAPVVVQLQTVAAIPAVKGSNGKNSSQTFIVYRDFTQQIEQQKLLWEMFYLKRHMNRLEKDNYGALYLADAWSQDFVQRFNFDACSKLNTFAEPTSQAKEICSTWNNARSPNDLYPLFFDAKTGNLKEMWVTAPGDVLSFEHPRHLISAPIKGAGTVQAFEGAYKTLQTSK